MISFESIIRSHSTIQVLESESSVQVTLVLSKALDKQISVIVSSTGTTATGQLMIFCIYFIDVDHERLCISC